VTEDQAKRIAFDFVAKSNPDPCEFDSIQRFRKSSLETTTSGGDERVVRFVFEQPDDVACSTEVAIVLVDDASGEPGSSTVFSEVKRSDPCGNGDEVSTLLRKFHGESKDTNQPGRSLLK
jgi:hypothetical protein